jgi:hypothetical protein
MFDASGMIALPIRDIVIVLSITFMVPWIGGIIGAAMKGLFRPHKEKNQVG